MNEPELRATHQVASVLLGYPDENLYAARPLLDEAVTALPAGPAKTGLTAFLDHIAAVTQVELAAHYVEMFDLRRRCCPYLTYYTYGDTRKRGMALLRFKHAYRAAGFELAGDELPDHLAVVCEFSARGATKEAARLLREHRAGLELMLQALRDEDSPYAHVVAAVRDTLPPPGIRERAAMLKLAEEGPPAEDVGLESYAMGELR